MKSLSNSCLLCIILCRFLGLYVFPGEVRSPLCFRVSRSVVVLVAMGLLLSGGCVTSITGGTFHSGVRQPVPSIHSDVPAIQKSPAFASVSASYRSGAFESALSQIAVIQRRTDLSPADRLFLDRQSVICRSAMRKPASPSPKKEAQNAQTVTAASLSDCGPRALLLVCRELDIPASLPALTKAAGTRPGTGSNLLGLSRAAHTVGLSTRGVQVDTDALRRVPTPALAWVDGDHFVAVTRIKDDSATVHDPNENGKEEVALDTLLRRSGGILLLLERGKDGRNAGNRSATKN